MSENNLTKLAELGVSIWLDDLSRDRIDSGNLSELTQTHQVVGVTTNPSIFQKALTEGTAYDQQLAELRTRKVSADQAVRSLTTFDVRAAADTLRPIFEQSQGQDGRVSIEVDPRLAHDTAGTIADAKDLWWLVDRENAMIKIPATEAGLPAITEVLANGISVNVTLIFSLERYGAVIDAYLSGLEAAAQRGHDLREIRSVASFFVSRFDGVIDAKLDEIGTEAALALKGHAALANARLAYQLFESKFSGPRWEALAAKGAQVQRPLWASTGVKNPDYPPTLYVLDLAVPQTVNTMPEATLFATKDSGEFRGDQVRSAYAKAQQTMAQLAELGIIYDEVVAHLEADGVQKFIDSWEAMLAHIGKELAE